MTNPAGEQVEGNVADIDIAAHYFILEDRQAKPFIKVFWTAALEGPAENPSYVFKKIKKLQPGYFAAPLVELEEETGGLQEAILIDLPWKDRPADFPKPQKKGGEGQTNWQPKKPRVTISATVNLQNYENIKVEVEGKDTDECTKILIDTLNGFAKNPAYKATRDMIQTYMARVLNTGGNT